MLDSHFRTLGISLVGLSIFLNVLALSLIGFLGVRVATNRANIKDLSTSANIRHEKMEIFKTQTESNLVGNGADIERLKEESNLISQFLDKTVRSEEWFKNKVNGIWKIGCPLWGISNGTSCFVLKKDKSNYSEAVDNCINEGGELAVLDDNNLMKGLFEKFPTHSYFVNGKYDESAGEWRTSDGKTADYLPWNITKKGKNGDCVYLHRQVFNQWHCNAKMFYLCAL